MHIDRRRFIELSGAGAALASSGLWVPRTARAELADPSGLKFIFVVNYGGWDITRVFANEFDNPLVDMESDAGTSSVGDLSFVDHDARPSVADFFDRNGDRSLILNGILVQSIAHENCMRICLTGSTAQDAPGWPAILAGNLATAFPLPHLVVAGPSYPGQFGAFVTRTGSSGQLEGLLSGSILDWSDTPVSAPEWRAEDIMDSYMSRRAAAFADGKLAAGGHAADLADAFARASERGRSLKDLLGVVEWAGGTSFSQQLDLAVDLLQLQVSRCVTVATGYSWDTHTNNDATQSSNFENLFGGLVDLMDKLRATPGTGTGNSLADETVLVVCSEMGRTPALNSSSGKDHWPYTSALICGPGVTGGRVVGGFDSYFYGRSVDLATGDIDDDGTLLSADVFGATLLQLAGIDPQDYRSGVSPMTGVLT